MAEIAPTDGQLSTFGSGRRRPSEEWSASDPGGEARFSSGGWRQLWLGLGLTVAARAFPSVLAVVGELEKGGPSVTETMPPVADGWGQGPDTGKAPDVAGTLATAGKWMVLPLAGGHTHPNSPPAMFRIESNSRANTCHRDR